MTYTSSWGRWPTPAGLRFFPTMPGSGLTTREMLATAVAQANLGQAVTVSAGKQSLERVARRLSEVLDDTGLGLRNGDRSFEIGAGSVKLMTPDEVAG